MSASRKIIYFTGKSTIKPLLQTSKKLDITEIWINIRLIFLNVISEDKDGSELVTTNYKIDAFWRIRNVSENSDSYIERETSNTSSLIFNASKTSKVNLVSKAFISKYYPITLIGIPSVLFTGLSCYNSRKLDETLQDEVNKTDSPLTNPYNITFTYDPEGPRISGSYSESKEDTTIEISFMKVLTGYGLLQKLSYSYLLENKKTNEKHEIVFEITGSEMANEAITMDILSIVIMIIVGIVTNQLIKRRIKGATPSE